MKHIVCALSMLGCHGMLLFSLYAQPITSAPVYVQIDQQTGLRQNFIYSVLRDQKGLIWIGTAKGLARYNGYDIKHFTVKDGLTEDFVTASSITSSGQLLFGHFRGSISLYNGASFRHLLNDTLQSEIVSVVEDNTKNIWCATRAKGLIRWDSVLRHPRFIFPEVLKGSLINQLEIVGDRLLAATGQGLYLFRIEGEELVFDHAPQRLLFKEITALEGVHANPSMCWVGSSQSGLYLLQLDKTTTLINSPSWASLSALNIRSIARSDSHSLWLGTFQKGVIYLRFGPRYTLRERQNINEYTGVPASSVNVLSVDNNTRLSVWAGTLNNGLVHINIPIFKRYIFPQRYTAHRIRINDVTRGPGRRFYIATNMGIFTFLPPWYGENKDTLTPLSIHQKENILSVEYTDGKLWVGSDAKGVKLWENNNETWTPQALSNPLLKSVKARFFEPDHHGNVWISTIGEGVIKTDPSGAALSRLSTATGFIHNDVFAIHPSRIRPGEVWFGSMGAGLARIDSSGAEQRFSQQGVFPSHDIKAITEDQRGDIWIATDNKGYFRYNGKTFIRVKDTLLNETKAYVKDIGYDGQNRIWITTQNAVSYMHTELGPMRRFEKERKWARNKDHFSSLVFGNHNDALIAGTRELYYFQLDDVPPPVALDVRLEGIQISFNPYATPTPSKTDMRRGIFPGVTLSHEQNHITFEVMAYDPTYMGTRYYRHYMEGLENTWSPPTTQRLVTYPSVAYGRHTLHVQASHDPKKWSAHEMTYSFIVQIPYWDTAWFYLLQITGIASFLGLTYLVARNPSSKQSISRVMVFACIFMLFEYAEEWLEPFTVRMVGSVPIYRILFKLLLALTLLPLERLFKVFLHGQKGH